MSRRVAPRARRMPISAGALGDGGQHDIHDANAADQQRDGGDRTQHDVEDLLGALGPPEQFQRHHDLVILLLVMALEQRP